MDNQSNGNGLPVPIRVITKSKIEQVQISLSTYKDKNLIDVRSYVAYGGDEHKPTQKGVSLPIDKIDDLIIGLNGARDEAVRRGWLK